MKKILDIEYREVGGIKMYVDLYLPDGVESPPLIFWIHGGGWMHGDRKGCALLNQVERGYAVSSVEYRLTGTAPFPACIEDCKYALAYLRDNAAKFGFDPKRVCVAGDSAGGHLSALMGVSAGHADWEPEGADCSAQAVIDFYGPAGLSNMRPPDFTETEVLDLLLGMPIRSKKGQMAAAAASPVTYITGAEPPFLIIHGDKDDVVPIGQSYMLRNELEKCGVRVAMHTVFGGGHGFESAAVGAVINEFLDYHFMK